MRKEPVTYRPLSRKYYLEYVIREGFDTLDIILLVDPLESPDNEDAGGRVTDVQLQHVNEKYELQEMKPCTAVGAGPRNRLEKIMQDTQHLHRGDWEKNMTVRMG